MGQTQPGTPAQTWGWAFLGLAVAVLAGGLVFLARWPSAGDMVEITLPTATPTPAVLKVHVAGAVVSPGVYDLLPGQRVQDAISAAGGPTEGANPQALNLAAPLRDGQKVFVPSVGADSPSPAPPSDQKVAINSATAKQLETLPLIGEKKARDIVSYREAHGPFRRLEDLLLVPGIGATTLERLRDMITLD
ncbi:MAG: ComEA family DNA-binding protein [Chloroflexi bacterium]|nr:ComEA family DNA-binding protein [Chloroflexota bacterium]